MERYARRIRVLDESISAEEIVSLEKKHAMKELLKERRSTEVKEWRVTVAPGGGVTLRAAAGSQSSKAEGDLFVSEVGVRQKDTEEAQKSFGHVEAPPLTSCMEQEHWRRRTRKNMEERSFVPQSARHAGPGRCAITRVDQRASNSSKLWLLSRKAQHTRLTLAGIATMEGERSKAKQR